MHVTVQLVSNNGRDSKVEENQSNGVLTSLVNEVVDFLP